MALRAGALGSLVSGPAGRGHVPAAAERLVELDDRRELVAPSLRERHLGGIEEQLRLDDLEVRGLARRVALRGKPDRVRAAAATAFSWLPRTSASRWPSRRARLRRRTAERGLLVAELGLLPRRLRLVVLAVEAAALEEGPETLAPTDQRSRAAQR